MGVCNCSMFCCTLLYVHSSIAIILMGKRELTALLNLSSWCLVMVERLFLAVPWGCLQFVIVVFPDHTHLLFFINWQIKKAQSSQHNAQTRQSLRCSQSHWQSVDVLAAEDSDLNEETIFFWICFFGGECAYAINNYISCASPIDDICKYILYGEHSVKNFCAILHKSYHFIYMRHFNYMRVWEQNTTIKNTLFSRK